MTGFELVDELDRAALAVAEATIARQGIEYPTSPQGVAYWSLLHWLAAEHPDTAREFIAQALP